MISGVCRWVPPTPYALAEPITSRAEQVGLGRLAGAGGAGGGDHDDARGVDEPGGDGRGERQRGDGRVAAGDRDPGGAGEQRRRWPASSGRP